MCESCGWLVVHGGCLGVDGVVWTVRCPVCTQTRGCTWVANVCVQLLVAMFLFACQRSLLDSLTLLRVRHYGSSDRQLHGAAPNGTQTKHIKPGENTKYKGLMALCRRWRLPR
jgi:hypothetical protein